MTSLGKVVIVDDVETNGIIMKHALSADGHTCVLASSAVEAMVHLEPRDTLVLDLDLGAGPSGRDILRAVRSQPELDDVPIIVVTGTDRSSQALAECLAAGAADYMTKPFDPRVLRARVGKARRDQLARRQRAEDLASIDNAAALQRAAMPAVPLAVSGLNISGASVAASGVAGDLFDVVTDTAGNVNVIVLDATGHGPAAAVVASGARGVARGRLAAGEPLPAVLDALERHLTEYRGAAEASVCIAILQFSREHACVSLVNAGLPPLLRVRDGAYEARHASHGPVGFLRRGSWTVETHALAPHDTWLVVTDGATNQHVDVDDVQTLGERLGLRTCRGVAATADPALLQAVLRENLEAPTSDDATLVVVHCDEVRQ